MLQQAAIGKRSHRRNNTPGATLATASMKSFANAFAHRGHGG